MSRRTGHGGRVHTVRPPHGLHLRLHGGVVWLPAVRRGRQANGCASHVVAACSCAALRRTAPYRTPVGPGVLETRHFTIQAHNKKFRSKRLKKRSAKTHTQAKESGPLAWVND